MANTTRATPTCIGSAFDSPTMPAYAQASTAAVQGPVAHAANSYTAAAGSLIAIPGSRLPSTQVTATKKIAASTNVAMMALPTTRRSPPSTSSARVDTASKPRKDMMQIEVALNILPASKVAASNSGLSVSAPLPLPACSAATPKARNPTMMMTCRATAMKLAREVTVMPNQLTAVVIATMDTIQTPRSTPGSSDSSATAISTYTNAGISR